VCDIIFFSFVFPREAKLAPLDETIVILTATVLQCARQQASVTAAFCNHGN
jgi:hypothetical protein